MKLIELFEDYEMTEDRVPWSPEELQVIFDTIKKIGSPFSKYDMAEIAKDLEASGGLERTKTGIGQQLMQMHAAVYGILPYGLIQYNGNWQTVSNKARRFVNDQGIDADANIKKAAKDHEQRIRDEQRKKDLPDRESALKQVADYFKGIKSKLPQNVINIIKQSREDLIHDVMAGLTAEEAFNRIIA